MGREALLTHAMMRKGLSSALSILLTTESLASIHCP
jgi:hypothetical protein